MKRFGWLAALLLLAPAGACSADDGGCKKDSDCKGDRICQGGECVDPGGGSGATGFGGTGFGGSGSGGSGGSGASSGSGGTAGCPEQCKTPAGTCCAGKNVCDSVPPCLGNPCCT